MTHRGGSAWKNMRAISNFPDNTRANGQEPIALAVSANDLDGLLGWLHLRSGGSCCTSLASLESASRQARIRRVNLTS